jgi:hypothetical protein
VIDIGLPDMDGYELARIAGSGASFALLAGLLVPVPIAILAADVGLIDFNNSHELLEIGIGQSRAEAVTHIPSRAVGTSAEHPVNLQCADAFFGREHQMENLEPCEQWLLGFLEDRPCRQREAIGRTVRLAALFALPVPRARLACVNVIVPAADALHRAIRPARRSRR